ncbi:MAG: peptidylprolyl isomerase [Flavobacteriales bacterium]|nr:peptidylprolyl isomerase [Flavobacteriales bacterium]
MSLSISDNLVVSMHYKLTDNEGNVLDDSTGNEPLAYLHGSKNIISGLESALAGKVEGDELQVKVAPKDGYGDVNPELIQTVPMEAFQGVEKVEEGMGFESQTPEGQIQRIVVKKVEGDEITIDGNHPLAGMELNFDVKIVEVREASDEEKEHGHVHGPGGHDH